MGAMIEIRDLHKRFGHVEVLKGVDLTVDMGKVVCVIGPSGSGKSTLLRCINHLERPDAGYVLVNGHFVGYRVVGDRLHEDWPDRVTEKPTILGIEQLAQDGVMIRCVTKTPPMKQWEVMREWRRRIKEEFERQGIEIPVGQKTIVLQSGEGSAKTR